MEKKTAVLSLKTFFFATDMFILEMDLHMLCYDKTMWRKSSTHWMPLSQKDSMISVEFWANNLLLLYLVLAGTHFTAEWTNAFPQCKILVFRIWHRWVQSVRSIKKQNSVQDLFSLIGFLYPSVIRQQLFRVGIRTEFIYISFFHSIHLRHTFSSETIKEWIICLPILYYASLLCIVPAYCGNRPIFWKKLIL